MTSLSTAGVPKHSGQVENTCIVQMFALAKRLLRFLSGPGTCRFWTFSARDLEVLVVERMRIL